MKILSGSLIKFISTRSHIKWSRISHYFKGKKKGFVVLKKGGAFIGISYHSSGLTLLIDPVKLGHLYKHLCNLFIKATVFTESAPLAMGSATLNSPMFRVSFLLA